MAKSKDTKGLFTLNRNYTLNSLKGHSIRFEKDEPTFVPPALYAEVLAIGAQAVDGKEVIDEDQVADPTPVDPAERQDQILGAIQVLVAKNDREDFTAAGSPTVGAVKEVLGYKVDAREVATAWQTYHEAEAAKQAE